MINNIKCQHGNFGELLSRIPTVLRYSSLGKQFHPPPPLSSQQLPQYVHRTLDQKLTGLSVKIDRFAYEFVQYSQIARRSSMAHVALFARSCLIAREKVPLDMSFPVVKKLVDGNGGLTAHSCTALMQCMLHFKFGGDEQKMLNRLCEFYRDNCVLFSFNQEKVFWRCYITIMSAKMHTSLKFIDLERRNNQIYEIVPFNLIVKRWMQYTQTNKKLIKNINTAFPDQVTITITKPQQKDQTLLVRLKQMDDLQLTAICNSKEDHNTLLHRRAMADIANINAMLKNGWNIILHGTVHLPTSEKHNAEQHPTQINQRTLNDQHCRMQLLKSNKYCEGVFYTHPNINTRKVDLIPTMLLGADPRYLPSTSIRFIEQNLKQGAENEAGNYMSLPQLRECYGLSKVYEFHWNLFDAYTELQKVILTTTLHQKNKKYNLDQIAQIAERSNIPEEKLRQYIASQPEMLASMAVSAANDVQWLQFERQYNIEYKRVHQFIGNYGEELTWQMRPFLSDTMRIMEQISEIAKTCKMRNEKNVKVVVMSHKFNLPYIFQNIVEAQYETVPKFPVGSNEQKQAKRDIMEELFLRTPINK